LDLITLFDVPSRLAEHLHSLGIAQEVPVIEQDGNLGQVTCSPF